MTSQILPTPNPLLYPSWSMGESIQDDDYDNVEDGKQTQQDAKEDARQFQRRRV